MWALKVTRSTMAATSRASGNTVPHSLKGGDADPDRGAFLAFGDDLEQQLQTVPLPAQTTFRCRGRPR
jgi:hypothetical protein